LLPTDTRHDTDNVLPKKCVCMRVRVRPH